MPLVGGTVIFTPEADFTGTATLECTASDGACTSTARVTVTVNP
ncbi:MULTISPECIES: cadherin-like domain-containing protein [Myxococcus]|nr:cadherin-like domain-containing protein [Myxococcus eversor]NVJ19676.1 cadherin-like domain-containing protein [Myxococcus sp. AM011]